MIIEKTSRKPYLIDFEAASYFPHLGTSLFRILRDHDIELFNLHFDTEKLTCDRMKTRIARIPDDDIYAPVYFGAGLRMGSIWNADSGYGRWRYILRHHLPRITDSRVLDLGANNAHVSMEMLRAGAREVVAVELNPGPVAQGQFVQAGFEWADNRAYNLRYVQAGMQDIPVMNLGRFDFVTALCSLYYLSDDSITELVEYLSTITSCFVVQANIASDIGRTDPHTYEKASVDYMRRVEMAVVVTNDATGRLGVGQPRRNGGK